MTTSIPIQIRHSTLYLKKIGSYYIVRDGIIMKQFFIY